MTLEDHALRMIRRYRQRRLRWTGYESTIAFWPFLLVAVAGGCATEADRHANASQPAVAPPITAMVQHRALAGTWEYEERGQRILITLDEYGRGTYEWKGGQFITTAFSNRVWKGLWLQQDNDREGEFEVTFPMDVTEGQGRWWYTRIGYDTAPAGPGGVFQIRRRSSSDGYMQAPVRSRMSSRNDRQSLEP